MASVHAAVVGVNRNGYVVTGIVSADYVITLLKGKVLAEPEYVLHNGDGAESQVVDLFLAVCVFLCGCQFACTYAYAELFAAVKPMTAPPCRESRRKYCSGHIWDSEPVSYVEYCYCQTKADL